MMRVLSHRHVRVIAGADHKGGFLLLAGSLQLFDEMPRTSLDAEKATVYK